jgi:hypothetical protein
MTALRRYLAIGFRHIGKIVSEISDVICGRL